MADETGEVSRGQAGKCRPSLSFASPWFLIPRMKWTLGHMHCSYAPFRTKQAFPQLPGLLPADSRS